MSAATPGRPKQGTAPATGRAGGPSPAGGSAVCAATSVGARFGRLQSAQRAQPMSDINVTPLVDVMLVLVVIFMLTAPLLASSIRLDLPNSDAAQAIGVPSFVTLVVDQQGQTFIDDKAVPLPELAERLTQAARNNPDTEVQLRADESVPYGKVVVVMGVAQKAGLNRIGFVTEPKAP